MRLQVLYKQSDPIHFLRRDNHIGNDLDSTVIRLKLFLHESLLHVNKISTILNIPKIKLFVFNQIRLYCFPFMNLCQFLQSIFLLYHLFLAEDLVHHSCEEDKACYDYEKGLIATLRVGWNTGLIFVEIETGGRVFHLSLFDLNLDWVDVVNGLKGTIKSHVLLWLRRLLRKYCIISKISFILSIFCCILFGVWPHRFPFLAAI